MLAGTVATAISVTVPPCILMSVGRKRCILKTAATARTASVRKCLERAAGVADHFPVEPVADAIGNAALEPLPRRVATRRAIAGNGSRPGALQRVHQTGNVGGVVLEVGVQRDDDRRARGPKARGEGCGLTRILRKRDHAQLGYCGRNA